MYFALVQTWLLPMDCILCMDACSVPTVVDFGRQKQLQCHPGSATTPGELDRGALDCDHGENSRLIMLPACQLPTRRYCHRIRKFLGATQVIDGCGDAAWSVCAGTGKLTLMFTRFTRHEQ